MALLQIIVRATDSRPGLIKSEMIGRWRPPLTLTVHHLDNSRSQRVLFLLEELGVPYEIQRYRRDPATMQAPASLRAIHPLGKSPVLTDDALRLAETGAIIEYLAAAYDDGTLMPPAGSAERRQVIYYLHYAEGSLMPLMLLSLVFGRLPRQAPLPLRPVLRRVSAGMRTRYLEPQLALHLDTLERALHDRPWFAGDRFGVADVQMSFPIEIAGLRLRLLGDARPKLQDWLERLRARPAYLRALERGGPYDLAF